MNTVKERLTDREQVPFTVAWTIENFSTYEGRTGLMYSDGITLAEMGFDGSYQGRWRMVIDTCHKYKDRYTKEDVECWAASLCMTDTSIHSRRYTWPHVLDATFKITMTTGRTTQTLMKTYCWDEAAGQTSSSRSSNDYKWNIVHSYDERCFRYHKRTKIEDDCVTFTITAVLHRDSRRVRVVEPAIPRAHEESKCVSKFLHRQIDGYRSQQHQKTADFVIRSQEGTEFHAHRYLLMAQSPIFAAMLTHNSREKQRSRCELQDVDGETVQLLLDYVYGCDTGKITKDNAEKVLIMADKYEMMDLRGLCEQTLADSISVEKAFPYLVLSVQRGLDVLKSAALRMMPKYLDAVLKGKGLEEVMQSDPELIQVFMDYCAKKLPQM
ncbi:uncharacterized protein LOC129595858 [Paramacrobiotus metropolitanus]|uniref:uncharacterized protein LOC129595858 n=1 Tax=Paramacrobiotus metropolitanus TaxID=2943436 RepID=UPI0024456086|nr:uncharacterized protein LOC129595858 [Paramacrobiotus metropolitanus]